MYSSTAHLYDLIYLHAKAYADEADRIAALLRAGPEAKVDGLWR